MKNFGLSIFIFIFSLPARAQADIQAMLKQIAKLEIYIIDLEKGYSIAKKGLTIIGDIKKGEFDLHQLFFSSLESVNPSVEKYSRIAEIISDQLSIVSRFNMLIKTIAASDRMTTVEMNYVQSVYTNMSMECTKNLQALTDVLTDGQLEMTDDERIKRIDAIWADMRDKYAFTESFTCQAAGIPLLRDDETNDGQLLKMLE